MTKMPFTPGEVLPLNATSALSNRFNPATLTIIGAKLTLDFLKTFSDTKSLARPKILTLNHQTAEIKITTDEVISVKTEFAAVGDTTKETKTYERANTGVTLKVTPMVNSETGEITMRINPIERNTRKSDFSTTAELVKDVEERSAKSLVKLKDGETVIMGGLIRNQFEQTNTKLPILGDIPFVGMLFRHKDKTKDVERELIVFITPRVIKDTNIQLAQAKKIILPEREQSTISGVSRELYINTSLNAFEKSRK
jgi:type II secretory pathway component GspD/PulD (secretin)